MRRTLLAATAAVLALSITGCSDYKGINSLDLPGTVGTGADSYQVTMKLNDAVNLVPNTPVLVNDLNVGTVTNVGLDGWTPVLTLSLRDDVKLPANATATLGQTSLLGSKHIALAPPTTEPPQGTLVDGAQIAEERSRRYPQTEEVLAGVSLLLNGGGLQHFQTITTELNRALGGRETEAREFLTQLNDFTAGLDKQKGDIVGALKGLDRLGGTLAPRMDEITKALDELPPGLTALEEQEPQIIKFFQAAGRLDPATVGLTTSVSGRLRDAVDDLEPVFRRIGDTKEDSVIKSLKQLPFVIFPLDAIPYAFRGDYIHIIFTLDLTNETLDQTFLTGTPAAGSLGNLNKVLQGKPPGLQANNPLLAPLNGGSNPLPMKPEKSPVDGDEGGLLKKPLKGIGG